MLRLITVFYLILHGAIHIIGFLLGYQLANFGELSYSTQIVGDLIEIGDTGARILAVAWLLLALALIFAGVALFFKPAWWPRYTVVITVISLLITIFGYPGAWMGIFANVIVLVFLFFNAKYAWLP